MKTRMNLRQTISDENQFRFLAWVEKEKVLENEVSGAYEDRKFLSAVLWVWNKFLANKTAISSRIVCLLSKLYRFSFIVLRHRMHSLTKTPSSELKHHRKNIFQTLNLLIFTLFRATNFQENFRNFKIHYRTLRQLSRGQRNFSI